MGELLDTLIAIRMGVGHSANGIAASPTLGPEQMREIRVLLDCAIASAMGHPREREHLGNIGDARCHNRSRRLHRTGAGILQDHLLDGVCSGHQERGGGSTSSVVNNAIWSSPLTKARSDWNEAGSVSLVAANGATAAG
jgi:hypothetical protein